MMKNGVIGDLDWNIGSLEWQVEITMLLVIGNAQGKRELWRRMMFTRI